MTAPASGIRQVTQHRYGPHRESDEPQLVTVGHPRARDPEDRERDVPVHGAVVTQRRRLNELAYLRGQEQQS